jgi:hypothetical protein
VNDMQHIVKLIHGKLRLCRTADYCEIIMVHKAHNGNWLVLHDNNVLMLKWLSWSYRTMVCTDYP